MNREKRFFVTFLLTVLVLSFIGRANVSASSGEETGWNPVADVMVGSSGINFMPKVNYARLLVSIARADGSVFQGTFYSGSTPYVDLSSIMGDTYLDGTYTYELRVIPNDSMKIRKDPEAGGLEKDEILPQKALTQSGSFSVQGGAVVTGGIEELDRTMDILHYDDVIITGSLCVGDDCADGESFGFSTIKLKENNLQIYFDDTSVSPFPTNDWKIQINDTNSGGVSYFTIVDIDGEWRRPFTIEAGAPAHSLYVEDYGRVGLGTSVPSVKLHIVNGDTPAVRLDQDASSGWSPQVWDLAGNELNFFIRDTTGEQKLPFRIQAGTPTNTLTLKSDGKVGLGTWSPEYKLELETTGEDAVLVAERTDGAAAQISATGIETMFGSRSNHNLNLIVNGMPRMIIDTSGKVDIGGNAVIWGNIGIIGQADINGGAGISGNVDILGSAGIIGNVGIGTSFPGFPLELKRTGTSATFVAAQTDGATAVVSAGGSYVFMGAKSNNDLRLLVNDSPKLTLTPGGQVGIGTVSPGFPLELETTGTAATFVADQTDGATAVFSAGVNYVFIGSKTNNDFRLLVGDSPKMTLMTTGYVGIGITNPTHLLHLSGGAYSDGATWKNASSIEYKENIQDLTTNEAMDALIGLKPVKFNYKADKNEECLGFIAEEVPELVAVNDRKGLCPMDITAVLAKVVQEQQKTLQAQQKAIQAQQKTISELKKKIARIENK